MHASKTFSKCYRKLACNTFVPCYFYCFNNNGIDWDCVLWSCGLCSSLRWSHTEATKGGSHRRSWCLCLVPHGLWQVFVLPTVALHVWLQTEADKLELWEKCCAGAVTTSVSDDRPGLRPPEEGCLYCYNNYCLATKVNKDVDTVPIIIESIKLLMPERSALLQSSFIS